MRSDFVVHSSAPRSGVVTLHGYGVAVRVEKGHLILEDGIGADRRRTRLARVGHGLKRLAVIGSDGMVSLAALRWLADQDASFMMLDRDGSMLASTGPVRSSDAKLRRSQALAIETGTALRISRELIDRKLAGQQKVALRELNDESTASAILRCRSELAEAESTDDVRSIEAQAAKLYWSAWRNLVITFPQKDLPRVPEHWQRFDSRKSSLTASARLATNPVNAMLNYLYALLEAEARFAAATLGLDPGMGVLHVDASYRDSLACDLMEPVRPEVDAFVLDWLKRAPLSRNSFFEERNGNCRLMAPFASKLSETSRTWSQLVAPLAEWFARQISNSASSSPRDLPARLTQRNKREVRGGDSLPKSKPILKPTRLCPVCGKELKPRSVTCFDCAQENNVHRITRAAARLGREASHTTKSEAKRAATQQVHTKAGWDWKPSIQPSWLTPQFYSEKIQPILTSTSSRSIARKIRVSFGYAGNIRKGRVPHPRHWLALAELVGLDA
jgi:CRISPR-associated endonuclease Cas1